MHRFLLFFLFPLFLYAAELHLPVQSVSENGKSAAVKVDQIAEGVHGFIVRHFTEDHSAIIADAYVSKFDPSNGEATLALSEYTGLKQNSLPKGHWPVQPGDEAILAFGYSRALLIAPSEDIYHIISSQKISAESNGSTLTALP
ncbi:plasminogen-binding N-terminal domain-containing protein, partial [bacterium]|nr:plasminogen-binding N-terminal domain-containing protein [bacterium]